MSNCYYALCSGTQKLPLSTEMSEYKYSIAMQTSRIFTGSGLYYLSYFKGGLFFKKFSCYFVVNPDKLTGRAYNPSTRFEQREKTKHFQSENSTKTNCLHTRAPSARFRY